MATYAMRAVGIPVTELSVPVWATIKVGTLSM